MANQQVIGVLLEIKTAGLEATTKMGDQISAALRDIASSQRQMGNAVRNNTRAVNRLGHATQNAMNKARSATERAHLGMIHFNQAVSSATTGFSHMYRYGTSALRGLGSVLTSVTADSASTLDTTMAGMDIVLGRIGNNHSREIEDRYQQAMGRVRELAMSTQFTMEQVGDSFTRLFQAGFNAEEAIGTLDSVLGFSTASMGAVGLEEAATLAALSVTALGSSIDHIKDNFGQMLRATQETRLQVGDFSQLFQSMQTSSATFSASATQDLLAVVGAQRQMGRSVAQSGNDLANTARSMGYLVRALTTGSEDGTAAGLRGGRVRQMAAGILGVDTSDIIDEEGRYLDLLTIIERIGAKFEDASERIGRAPAEAWLQALFGSQQARNLIVNSLRYEEAYGRSVRSLAGTIGESGNILGDAQERVLDTFEGKTALLSGVWDNLKAEIGMAIFPALKASMDELFRFTAAMSEVVRNNPETVRKIIHVIGYMALLVGVLTALAGAAMMVGTVMMVTGPLMTAFGMKGLGLVGVFKQFIFTGLLPMLQLFGPLMLGIASLALVMYGFKRAFDTNFGGVAADMRKWTADMRQGFNVFRRIITADGIDAEEWDALTEKQQELVIGMRRAWTGIQDFFKSFGESFVSFMSPVVSVGFKIATIIARWAGVSSDFLGSLGKSRNEFEGFRTSMTAWGKVAGRVLGFALLLKTALAGLRVIAMAWATVLGGLKFVMALFSIATWKAFFASAAFYLKAALIVGTIALLAYGFSKLSPEMQKFVLIAGAASAVLWLMRRRLYAVVAARAGISLVNLALVPLLKTLVLGKVLLAGFAFAGGYVFGDAMRKWGRDGVMYFRDEIEMLIDSLDRLWHKMTDASFSQWFNKYFGSGWGDGSGIGGVAGALLTATPLGVVLDPVQEITRDRENAAVMAGAREARGTPISGSFSVRPPQSEGWRPVDSRNAVEQTIDASVRVENLTIQATDSTEESARQILDNVQRMWGRNVERQLRATMQTA